ncbi:MAG: hypothetical protein ACYC99_10960 [Candidatus Geothermincolia bacterium]
MRVPAQSKRINSMARRTTVVSLAVITSAIAVLLLASWCFAGVQWTKDGVVLRGPGLPNSSQYPQITPDGSGGAIVTWQDNRSMHQYGIYAQRVFSNGAADPRWPVNGVALRGAWEEPPPFTDLSAYSPEIIPDGSGGAVITWMDMRSGTSQYQVYAQRVSASGAVQWTANGVKLRGAEEPDSGYHPQITSDCSGGAIITWYDARSGQADIYAQRILSNGTVDPAWPVNGRQLRGGVSGDALYPRITSDGSGDAIVTWQDNRSGHLDIYAQRVLPNGTVDPAWPVNGRQLRGAGMSGDAYVPEITSDGSSGALVTWQDNRSGHLDIYAQRVLPNGTIDSSWPTNGKQLWAAGPSTGSSYPQIANDGAGGAIVTWEVGHTDGSGDNEIYAQRVCLNGTIGASWPVNGVELRGNGLSHNALDPQIIPDGAGGAIVTWEDRRSGSELHIYAQKVNVAGKVQWVENGLELRGAGAPGYGQEPEITSDGSGGAIVTWQDHRSAGWCVYAQRASDDPSPSLTWYLAEGTNAWGFSTYITITNPEDTAASARLTYMDPNPPSAGKGILKSRTIVLPPGSQTTVSSMSDIGEVDFSTKVECLQGTTIAVDRTMFWNGEGYSSAQSGYHSSIGTDTTSKTWYLPEGSSAWGFETWTLVLNPNPSKADVTLTYMTPSGPRQFNKTVPANSRASYSMASDIGAADASIKVASNLPVVAERSMYRNNRREGSCSIGATAPANDFFLAEGATGYNVGFTTYVLVQNPQNTTNDVSLTYQTASGQVKGPTFTMEPNSRRTVKLNDTLPPNTDVSTAVHGSKPLIAERAMYWDNGSGQAFHASIGLASPHYFFMLPDGQTSAGFETWTLVENPNPVAVKIGIVYLPQGGGASVFYSSEIAANSRRSFNMADKVASGRASILVFSMDARPIMVERSMYMNNRGAGTDTIGGYEG